MKVSGDSLPRRANLGCGYDIRVGYLNVDLHERHGPDLAANILDLHMLPSGWFEEIVAQDVLEHVERHKVHIALKEWARLLAPGGVIQVRVPSLELMFKILSQPKNRPAEEAAKVIHLMYGTQEYTGDYHLAGFTSTVLEKHLHDVGLQICRTDIAHGWCFDVYARKCEAVTDPAEFVHGAYFSVLGRPADPGGLNHFVLAMAGGMTRDRVLEELRNSREGRALRDWPSYLTDHIDAVEAHANPTPAPAPQPPTVRGALRDLKRALHDKLRAADRA